MSDQTVVPMISYEDGFAALDWLARAFGFREVTRMEYEGWLAHGEMDVGDGNLIMLATPTPAYRSPRSHRRECAAANEWSKVPWVIDGCLVHVNDVDSHFQQAKREGAIILSEVEDGPPGRRYRAEDLEGHRWMFIQR